MEDDSMFCTNCGKKLDDDSKFCIYCGSKVDNCEEKSKSLLKEKPFILLPCVNALKQDKKKWFLVIIILATLVLMTVFLGVNGISRDMRYRHQISLGERYLSDMDYEAAIVAFNKAIEIDPKRADSYLGKADAYIGLGDWYQALDTVEEGIQKVPNDNRLVDKAKEIQDMIYQLESVNPEEDVILNEMVTSDVGVVGTSKRLNYQNIVRWVNSDLPDIQLIVLDGETELDGSEFTWSSKYSDVAEVSDTGMVSCKGKGYTQVKVQGDGLNLTCDVYVVQRYEEVLTDYGELEQRNYIEGENIVQKDDNGPQIPYYVLKTDMDSDEPYLPWDSGMFVYFSGNVRIPDHLIYKGAEIEVKKVEFYSYYKYQGIEEVKKVTIPAGVTINTWLNPFYYCINLQEIIVEDGSENYVVEDGVLFSKDKKTLFAYPAMKEGTEYTIPASVERIADGAFYGCSNLEQIKVEEGNNVFSSIDGVLMNEQEHSLVAYPSGKKDNSYAIPDGIAGIKQGAFGKADMLEKVVSSGDVETLSSDAFDSCINLKEVTGLDKAEYLNDGMFNDCPRLCKVLGGVGTESYVFGSRSLAVESLDFKEFTEIMPNLTYISVFAKEIKNVEYLKSLKGLTDINICLTDENIDAEQLRDEIQELLPNCSVSIY